MAKVVCHACRNVYGEQHVLRRYDIPDPLTGRIHAEGVDQCPRCEQVGTVDFLRSNMREIHEPEQRLGAA